MSNLISNIPYTELAIGQSASMSRTVSAEDIALFAAASHDTNPAHLDADYAADTQFKHVIMHGIWSAGLISAVIGTKPHWTRLFGQLAHCVRCVVTSPPVRTS